MVAAVGNDVGVGGGDGSGGGEGEMLPKGLPRRAACWGGFSKKRIVFVTSVCDMLVAAEFVVKLWIGLYSFL